MQDSNQLPATEATLGLLFPQPQNPPPPPDVGVTGASFASFPLVCLSGVIGIACGPLLEVSLWFAGRDGTPSILRIASSLALTSSSSCRAMASPVLALTSSISSASSSTGAWSSVARIACVTRLAPRRGRPVAGSRAEGGVAGARFVVIDSDRSLNSRRPVPLPMLIRDNRLSVVSDRRIVGIGGVSGSDQVIEERLLARCMLEIVCSSFCLSRKPSCSLVRASRSCSRVVVISAS